MSGSSDWCDVPGDVWFSIGLRLDEASDRIRFRAVSKTLRSQLPYRQPPWLMLSEYHDDDGDDKDKDEPPRRRFVILGEQSYYKFHLPQAHLARCVGSTNTWVITIKTDVIIRLLNPFSKLEYDLPSARTFEHQLVEIPYRSYGELQRDTFLSKVIICPPASSTETNLLAIALQIDGKLAMARPGDSFWTSVRIEDWNHARLQDMVVYEGRRLFAINREGVFLSCEIPNHRNSSPLISPLLSPFGPTFDKFQLHDYKDAHHLEKLYLVECCDQLLLVIKCIHIFGLTEDREILSLPYYRTETFLIYKFDFPTMNWIEIQNLGEYSLFLGYNTSVSVLASEFFGLVEKNCIYFTDDFWFGYFKEASPGGYDMGVFHLDDHTISPHYKGISTCRFSPPIWIVPDQEETKKK